MTVSINGVKKQTLNIGQAINGQNPVIPGLIAHYTFDDISGATVADETGSFPGTLINGPTVVNGQLGNGTDFDSASTQYMDAGVAMGNSLGNGVSALTLSLWFKADIIPGSTKGLIYIGNFTSNGKMQIALAVDVLRFRLNSVEINESITFSDTTFWHNVVFVYNGAKALGYLDNVEVMNEIYSTGIDLTGQKTIIGAVFSTIATFDGKIDQVRIFNRALTVPEIDQLFNEKIGPWIYENGRRL